MNAVWPLDTILFLDFNKAQGVKTVRTDGLDLFYFARQMNASVVCACGSCDLPVTGPDECKADSTRAAKQGVEGRCE